MGAFVSVPECQAHYNITLNCSFTHSYEPGRRFATLGDYERGEVPSDPDIAGVGILGVFLAVTSLAIFLSLVDVLWQVAKVWDWKNRYNSEEEKRAKKDDRSFSELLETMIIACSDQQVFTGAAYSLSLRYWRGCTILSYHYNIFANMLLLTCATHLMSVTVVRNYWKFPWLAILRIICISGVFIVAGVPLTKQNAHEKFPPFPTEVPPTNETDSIIFLPAACFQTPLSNALSETFENTTENGPAFVDTLKWSKPGNQIQGWNWYILILLFYGAAIIAEIVRFVRRGRSRPGWRAKLASFFGRCFGRSLSRGTLARRIIQNVFLLYLAGGVGISIAATIISAKYMFSLRRWADNSGWLQLEDGKNPENDFSSFSQLVPIWTSAMIVFSFFGTISEMITRRSSRKHAKDERPPQEGTIAYLDPLHYDLLPPESGKQKASPKPGKQKTSSSFSPNPNHHTPTAAAPGSTDLEAQHSEPPSQINTSGAGSQPLGSLPTLSSSPLIEFTGLPITTPDTPRPHSRNETSTTGTVAGAGTGHPSDDAGATPPGKIHTSSSQNLDPGVSSSAASQSSPPSKTRPQGETSTPSQPTTKDKPTPPKRDSSS